MFVRRTNWDHYGKPRGQDLDIRYSFVSCETDNSHQGQWLVAWTDFGVCYVGREYLGLLEHFPYAEFSKDDPRKATSVIAPWLDQGRCGPAHCSVDLYGTGFQLLVWQALIDIPWGECVSYQDIAEKIGKPHAARAVGQAIGANPVALIVPCHRVLRNDGDTGGYAYGTRIKESLLLREKSPRHLPVAKGFRAFVKRAA